MKVSRELEAAILAQAIAVNGVPVQSHLDNKVGAKIPPARKPLAVRTSVQPRLVMEFDIAARTASEPNIGGQLSRKISRKSEVKRIAAESLPRLREPFPTPCRVTLTRHGLKQLDDDNLRTALKAIRDVIAGWVGVDDGDKQHIVWRYRQVASWVPFVRVRVESVNRGQS